MKSLIRLLLVLSFVVWSVGGGLYFDTFPKAEVFRDNVYYRTWIQAPLDAWLRSSKNSNLEVIAKVQSINGEIFLREGLDLSSRRMRKDQVDLRNMTLLRSGEDSKLVIQFENKEKFELKPNSVVFLARNPGAQNDGSFSVFLLQGEVQTQSPEVKSKIKVFAPIARVKAKSKRSPAAVASSLSSESIQAEPPEEEAIEPDSLLASSSPSLGDMALTSPGIEEVTVEEIPAEVLNAPATEQAPLESANLQANEPVPEVVATTTTFPTPPKKKAVVKAPPLPKVKVVKLPPAIRRYRILQAIDSYEKGDLGNAQNLAARVVVDRNYSSNGTFEGGMEISLDLLLKSYLKESRCQEARDLLHNIETNYSSNAKAQQNMRGWRTKVGQQCGG